MSLVVFGGGLVQEDLDSLSRKLPTEKEVELQRVLTPHVNELASHELPEDSGAITGSYSEDKAELWIDEYEETIPEVWLEDEDS